MQLISDALLIRAREPVGGLPVLSANHAASASGHTVASCEENPYIVHGPRHHGDHLLSGDVGRRVEVGGVLLGHADEHSFNGSLADAYVRGWSSTGREVERIALWMADALIDAMWKSVSGVTLPAASISRTP